MLDNQLGRRNLSEHDYTMLLGRRYELEKKAQGGTGANQHTKEQNGNNYQSATTAETIAKQQGVSEKTVRNAAKYAKSVDSLKDQRVKLIL